MCQYTNVSSIILPLLLERRLFALPLCRLASARTALLGKEDEDFFEVFFYCSKNTQFPCVSVVGACDVGCDRDCDRGAATSKTGTRNSNPEDRIVVNFLKTLSRGARDPLEVYVCRDE